MVRLDVGEIRKTADEMGPLRDDARKTKRGDAIADIKVLPTTLYAVRRLVPTPIWGKQGARKTNGLWLYYHQPVTIFVKAFNTPHAVRLVDGPERSNDGRYEEGGVFERLVSGAWRGFPSLARPWRDARGGETYRFKLIEMDDVVEEEVVWGQS